MRVARNLRAAAVVTALAAASPAAARAQTTPDVPSAPTEAHADTVYLRDGQVLRGTIVSVVPDIEVRIRLATGELKTVPRSDVMNFVRAQTDEPSAPPAPSREPAPSSKSSKQNGVAAGIVVLIAGPTLAGLTWFTVVNLSHAMGEGNGGKTTSSAGEDGVVSLCAGVAITSAALGLYLIIANSDAGPSRTVSSAAPQPVLFETREAHVVARIPKPTLTVPILTARF